MCLAACAALDASMSLFAKASLALPRSLIAIWELSVGMMGLSEKFTGRSVFQVSGPSRGPPKIGELISMPTSPSTVGPCNEVRYGAVLLLRLNPDYVSFLNITHAFGFKLPWYQ